MLRTLVIRTMPELELYKEAWTALSARAVNGLVFQTPDWAIGWWRVLQSPGMLYCVALLDEARLVGFAPLCLVNPFKVRVVQFMGGEANDANAFLVETGYAEAFGNALEQVLRANPSEWDALLLTPTSVQDPVLQVLRDRLAAHCVSVALRPTALPYADLPKSWEAYWNGLSRGRTKTWMHSRRDLERKGKVSFRLVTDAAGVAEGIRRLLAVRAENWAARKRYGKIIPLQRAPEFQETLVAICQKLAAQEGAWLAQYCLDDEPIGLELVLAHSGTFWDYLTTYDRAFAVYSPGVWVGLETTRAAIAHGLERVYMGRGEQSYKSWMGGLSAMAEPLCVAQTNARGLAFLLYHAAYDRAAAMYQRLRASH